MAFFREAAANLAQALRLARFDGAAADGVPDDDRSVWRSFWAIPAVLILDRLVASLTEGAFSEADESLGRSSLASGWLAVGWLLGLNIAAEFARYMNRRERWPRYVAAHNWAALLQAGIFAVGVVVLTAFGASTDIYGLWVLAIGFWSLIFDWFVVKATLKVDGAPAALLMIILFFASLFVTQVAIGFSR